MKFNNHNRIKDKPNDQIPQVLMEGYNRVFYSFDIHEILGIAYHQYPYLERNWVGKITVHMFIFLYF